MIEELKPYKSYRPAQIAWAPSLPSGWEVRRAKRLFTRVQRPVRGSDGTVTCFRDGTVTLRKNRRTTGFTEAIFELGYQGIRRGDLVIHAMDAFAGAVGVSDSDGKGSPVYAVCEPREGAQPAYYAHVVREMARSQWIIALSRGIRQRSTDFRFDVFAVQSVPVPPAREQDAIVRFLAYANGRIDRFIRSKKELIALLNEQKQAIIHRAVTRGLDPNVTLKESGVPWVSEMPAHWQLTPNRAHLRVRKVLVGARHREYQLLSLTKRGVIIRDLSENKGKFSSDMGTSQEVRAGDLVFCLFDVPETPRTVGLSPHNGMITGAYTVMECRDLSIARFLEAFYIAMDDSKLLSPLYSGLRNTIPKDRLLGAKTPIPPAGERERILSYIAKETRAIQAGIDWTSAEIALVQEYRARLVADVVTGQLDVRTAAAGLPVVEPEAEPTEIEGDETDIEDGEAA